MKANTIDKKLVLILSLISIQILSMSYFYTSGGLTADSMNYLRLANSITSGQGFFVNDLYQFNGESYFSVWPVGYPFITAIIAKAFFLDTFLASKITNILFIILAAFAFSKIYKHNAYIFTALFLLDFMARITYRTWSETPFIVGFIVFAILLAQYHYKRENSTLLAIMICSVSCFLFRYIGATTLFAMAIMGLYYLYQKEFKAFIKLATAGCMSLTLMLGYFAINVHYTGYMSGINRINTTDDISYLLYKLTTRELEQYKLLVIAGLLCTVLIIMKKLKPADHKVIDDHSRSYWPFFLSVGVSYWITIIGMRLFIAFDDFGSRILAPGTFLFILAFIDYMRLNSKYFKAYTQCLIVILLMSCVYHTIYKPISFWSQQKPTYNQNIQEASARYAELKSDSIVLYGEYDMLYLRNDIQPAAGFPYYGNRLYGKKHHHLYQETIQPGESLNSFTKRICKSNVSTLYIDTHQWYKQNSHEQHEAIKPFIQAHEQNNKRILKIADCPNYK